MYVNAKFMSLVSVFCKWLTFWFERCIDCNFKPCTSPENRFCGQWSILYFFRLEEILISMITVTRITISKCSITWGGRRDRRYKKTHCISDDTWHQVTYGPETNFLESIRYYCSCMYMFILCTLFFLLNSAAAMAALICIRALPWHLKHGRIPMRILPSKRRLHLI